MADKSIPRRTFLKKAGLAASTAITTGLAAGAPAPSAAQSERPVRRAAPPTWFLRTQRSSPSIATSPSRRRSRSPATGSSRSVRMPRWRRTPRRRRAWSTSRARTVMPGIIDGHAHMDREGLKGVYPALGPVRSIRDIQNRIAELARGKPRGEWIVTMPIGDPPYYFDVPDILAEKRWPTRQELDAAAPEQSGFHPFDLGLLASQPAARRRSPTPRRSGAPASPATRSRRWRR